jgi:F420H(2)-dependent quinone reductase
VVPARSAGGSLDPHHREVASGKRWARAVQAYPDYADYQKKTDRVIPVIVLSPSE